MQGMIFNFFKILFKGSGDTSVKPNKQEENDVIVESIHLDVNDVYLPIKPPPNIKENIKLPKHSSKISKPDIIDLTKKEINMSEIYLVVLDGTGRTNFKALTQNIQNFYFVVAQDSEKAKEMVLYSFMRAQRRPSDQLINEINSALKVTPISAIFKNMSPQNNFWTYIPFGKRAGAGQQIVPPNPSQQLAVRSDPNMPDASSALQYQPAAPVGGVEVNADDLKGVQFDAREGNLINKLRSSNGPIAPLPEDAPPLNPDQEAAVEALKSQNIALANQNKVIMEQMAQMNDMMKGVIALQNAANTPRGRRKQQPTPTEGEQ